ncbi:hypothetical protein [uncultured Piscinibacter sp.]|uniref:hypothetical protein n=1 Tax=uncultured Piscinibacter sp. TaxID=1131835 RepID=UPI002605BAF1|nr:hypothetical protein [uncultured Piscinibacter sp.]
MRAAAIALSASAWLAACSSGPLPPDWQLQAKPALEAAVSAHLGGDSRSAQREFERARGLLARTGQPALVARAELMRCAAQVASLDFTPCEGFERWRSDAAEAERSYADHLAGLALSKAQIEQLPPAQRGVAAAIAAKTPVAVQAVEDAQSRLIAAALLFRAGLADPATIALASDTASAQGWRRPLLAWLEVQAMRAERAGATEEAQRLRRRIALVAGSR